MQNHERWTISVAVALVTVSALLAQPRGRGGSQMMYDTKTETTINGTVTAVTQASRGMMVGTHLTVKTPEVDYDVRLGPANFIASKGFTFNKGDEVQVTGSKVTMGGMEMLIAREVVKAGQTLTLRDKSGKPEWGGMRRGATP